MTYFFEDVTEKVNEVFCECIQSNVSETTVVLSPQTDEETATLRAYSSMRHKTFTKEAQQVMTEKLLAFGFTELWATDWMSSSHVYYKRFQFGNQNLFVQMFYKDEPSKHERIAKLKQELEELENES